MTKPRIPTSIATIAARSLSKGGRLAVIVGSTAASLVGCGAHMQVRVDILDRAYVQSAAWRETNVFARGDAVRALLSGGSGSRLAAQQAEAERNVTAAAELIGSVLRTQGAGGPGNEGVAKMARELKQRVSETQGRISQTYKRTREEYEAALKLLDRVPFASDPPAGATTSSHSRRQKAEPGRTELLMMANARFDEGGRLLEELASSLDSYLNLRAVTAFFETSTDDSAVNLSSEVSVIPAGPPAAATTRGTASTPAIANATPATASDSAASAATASAEKLVDGAEVAARRGIVGPNGLFDDPHASQVVYAPKQFWHKRELGDRPFNFSGGTGMMGNADIAIRMDGPGDFSLKGVRVDSAKVAQASFAGIAQAVRIVASVYGVTLPGKTPDFMKLDDATSGVTADAGGAIRTADSSRRANQAAIAQRRAAALGVLTAIADEADALAAKPPATAGAAPVEPGDAAVLASLKRIRDAFAALETSLKATAVKATAANP